MGSNEISAGRENMKKKIAIYWLILRSLATDYAKSVWDAVVARVSASNEKSDIKLEGMRLLLLGRYRASRTEKRTRIRISGIGAAAVAFVVVFSVFASSQVFSVSVNGQVVGYVHDRTEYASLVNGAKEKISKENGISEILINDTDIKIRPVIRPGLARSVSENGDSVLVQSPSSSESASAQETQDVASGAADPASAGASGGSSVAETNNEALEDALIDTLIREDFIKATVYNINIDGQPMATLATMKEASDVLQNIAAAYSVDGEGITAGFADDIQIIGKTIDLDSVRTESVESVTEYLLNGIDNVQTYTAKAKDKMEDVMTALAVTEEELNYAYPEYDFYLIQEGDVFEYTRNTPYIQYETSGVEEADVAIPYTTIEKQTNTLYLGERETEVAGVDGLRHVKRDVTRINGVIINSEEIYSETLIEASPATVLTGTLLVPGDVGLFGEAGGGPLGRPLASWSFSRGLGGAHTGDDMCAPQGTPIWAAEHGVVSFTGEAGGYGNLIKVDHGNGLVTYYAHCDTINVATGQVVDRGQQIGTVGITGRATAYHLHFEVRVDNVPQEPLDWIS
jgi:murein DD-endopeptidase MepM/ murein hydrolase activator NlpD